MNDNKKLCVALGDFDGVHLGHQSLLKAAVNNGLGLVPAVYTFEDNCKGARLVTTPSEKEALMRSFGVEQVIFDRFESVKSLTPAQFVDLVLDKRLGAGAVVCGEDYRFGSGAAGDVSELQALCGKAGITVIVVGDHTVDGKKISSSDLRAYIEKGDMERAARLMGRPFSVTGSVTHGKHFGSTRGTPTVNVKLDGGRALPPYGVYVSSVGIDGKTFRGVSNLGVAPTVKNMPSPLLETHIFDYSGEIYGETVTVNLLKFLRPETVFPDADSLYVQIARDIASAHEYFSGDKNEKNS